MPKKKYHQPKSYPTDMAHPTERRDCYINRDIVRFYLHIFRQPYIQSTLYFGNVQSHQLSDRSISTSELAI